MQAWIYERFPTFQVKHDENFDFTKPRSERWKPDPSQSKKCGPIRLKSIRALINGLKKEQVIWMPYHANQDNLSDILWFSGCLRAVDVTEPYHPDRVARQFGHVQLVPRDPLEPVKCDRTKANFKVYSVTHDEPERNYERWKDHLITSEARGPKVVHPHDCSPDYETWFRAHSYPLLTSKSCPENYEVVEPIPTRELRIFSRVKNMLEATLYKPKATVRDFKKTVTDVINLVNSAVFEPMEGDRDDPLRDNETVIEPMEDDKDDPPRDHET